MECFYYILSFISSDSLFELSISSWFSFGDPYVSRKLSIASRLSKLLAYDYSQYLLKVFRISAVSVEISPFSYFFKLWELSIWVFYLFIYFDFYIMIFIRVLSLFFSMRLARDLWILFAVSKNQLLVLLILLLFLISTLFISSVIFMISFLLLTLGFVCPFSNSLRW